MVKKLQNLIKNEKGSVTVFVLAAMLLFLTTGGIAYMNVSNKTNAQLEQVEKIQEEYAKGTNPEEIEEIYQEAIEEPDKPIDLEVILTPNTKEWTNEDVTVTITYPQGDITSEITITGTEGKDYEISEDGTEVIIKTNNTTITVTVEDDKGNSVIEELTISNIDKKGPSVTYMPDGGTYVKPKNSDAIIKTRITATDVAVKNIF